jgi:haloalkane dehalogenase
VRTALETRSYLLTADGQIHVRERGTGTAVVLIHQNAHSSTMWESLLGPLAARGYRAIALDLPGCGLSDPPAAGPPGLAGYASTVDRLAQALGLARYGVVGQHVGASIGLQLAVEHPDRIIGVIGLGLFAGERTLAKAFAAAVPPVYDREGTELLRQWELRWTVGGTAMTPTLALRTLIDELRSTPQRHHGLLALASADHEALLDALQRPYLVLGSSNDLFYEESQRAAERSTQARFHDIGVEHGLYFADEAPEEYAELIDAHLRAAHGP